MGRVATVQTHRGKGIGRVLIDVLEEHLNERKGKAGEALKGEAEVESIAHSQAYAQGFYEKVSRSSLPPASFVKIFPRTVSLTTRPFVS
jgi:ribosomal protein S18 acetylase RimI-like enzyme